MKNKFYYIFKNRNYVGTEVGIPALAKFLNRPLESVYASMSINRKKKRKEYILKDYEGNKYSVQTEEQFFGKKNLKC